MIEQLAFQLKDGGLIPTSPLQMRVREISVFAACKLNAKWHSRLPVIDWSNVVRNTYYVCYGASFDNHWFAVAIWSDPVARNRLREGDTMLELRRMAISPESPRYTASWMIGVMVKLIKKRFPKLTRLISYQDTEVHTGTIYKASGWQSAFVSKGIDWTTVSRNRNRPQTLADKIRWELVLRDVAKA